MFKRILIITAALFIIIPQAAAEDIPSNNESVVLASNNDYELEQWKEIRIEATAYCNCKICTRSGKGITASGKMPSRGTVAAPGHIPFGTVIKIDGLGEFIVQDRGNAIVEKNGVVCIDIWMASHEEAVKFGRKKNMKGWIKVENQ
jgi:3D (Asp-Asp-Asp) domain-containing protein